MPTCDHCRAESDGRGMRGASVYRKSDGARVRLCRYCYETWHVMFEYDLLPPAASTTPQHVRTL